jgi:predicted RNA binding protein YcfA (HicA-like mRNA interferase family)
MERDSRRLIQLLREAGWELIDVHGSHHQFRHRERPGKVSVPHPRKDIPIGTVRSIYRQAGWLK